jgi:hypothetical protein
MFVTLPILPGLEFRLEDLEARDNRLLMCLFGSIFISIFFCLFVCFLGPWLLDWGRVGSCLQEKRRLGGLLDRDGKPES